MNAIVGTLLVFLGVAVAAVHSFSSSGLVAPTTFHTSERITIRQHALFSSRQQPYEDDEDYYDNNDSTRFREVSQEEIGLREMARSTNRRSDDEYEYDDEYDDEEEEADDYYRPRRNEKSRNSRNGRLTRFNGGEDAYDDEDEPEEEPLAGNFWSNPTSRVNRPPSTIVRRGRQQQLQRRYDDDDDYYDDDRSRRGRRRSRSQERRPGRSRSGVPSSMGEPPRVLKDLYDQLFWFGFDSDDTAIVGDKTAFGGTKGKFNGFNYLLEASEEKSSRRRPTNARRLPPSGNKEAMTTSTSRRRRNDEREYYDDDTDDLEDDDYYPQSSSTESNRTDRSSLSYTPPTDRPTGRTSTRDSRLDDNYYDNENEEDNYGGGDNYDDDDYYDDRDDYTDRRRPTTRRRSSPPPRFEDDQDEYQDRRSGRRRQRRQQGRRRSESSGEWSPLNMIESFLGIDREEMDYKAEMYNAKMGLGKKGQRRDTDRRRPPQRRSARDDPGRPGYAYRYDATEDDDESTPILDVDMAYDEQDDLQESATPRSKSRRRQLSVVDGTDEPNQPRRKERSWEERQIAMERVPPANVIAWGPSGELNMSAREKAFLDAQEDIELARRRLKLLKQKESDAKEEISILKVEANRQKLKLEERPEDIRFRRDIEELRQIELDVADAARELRQYRLRVQRATEKLEELEERHHALLSCYNFEQASMLIGESLNEISTSLPGSNTGGVVSANGSASVSTSSPQARVPNDTATNEVDASASESTDN
jgi:hypothetical protein